MTNKVFEQAAYNMSRFLMEGENYNWIEIAQKYKYENQFSLSQNL